MTKIFGQIKHDAFAWIQALRSEAKTIWQASKKTYLLADITQVFFGAMPVLLLVTIGFTVDALVGARGIGVWTSDVTKGLTYVAAALALIIPAAGFYRASSGLLRSLCRRVFELAFVITTLLVSLFIAPVHAVVQLIIVFLGGYTVHAWLRYVSQVVVLLLFIMITGTIVSAVILSEITLGTGVFYAGSYLLLLGWSLWKIHYLSYARHH